MKVLVLGGTGTVGSQVVKELLSRKAEVSVLTRSPEKAKGLPAGVRAVTGNLLEPATVRSIFRGMDAVFLLNPVGYSESYEGLMAVNGLRLGGVGRVVYLSVQAADEAAYLPHFGSKVGVEAGLKSAGVEWTILRPNNFYQNDNWLKDAILQHGAYPQPIGEKGCSRVDVRDVAEAAAIVLTGGGHAGETYNLVGPEALTGTETAAIWSRVLGKPIAYAGNDLDAWEKQFLQYMPAWMVFDYREMYEFFQTKGFRGTSEDVARQTKLIGHAPRRFEDWAREAAAAWKASA